MILNGAALWSMCTVLPMCLAGGEVSKKKTSSNSDGSNSNPESSSNSEIEPKPETNMLYLSKIMPEVERYINEMCAVPPVSRCDRSWPWPARAHSGDEHKRARDIFEKELERALMLRGVAVKYSDAMRPFASQTYPQPATIGTEGEFEGEALSAVQCAYSRWLRGESILSGSEHSSEFTNKARSLYYSGGSAIKYKDARNMLMATVLVTPQEGGLLGLKRSFSNYFAELLVAHCSLGNQLAIDYEDKKATIRHIYLHILENLPSAQSCQN